MRRRIAHITDTHLDEKEVFEKGVDARQNLLVILDDVAKRDVDEILFAGDIGETSSLKWFFNQLYHYTGKLKINLGNHDRYKEIVSFFNQRSNAQSQELYYSDEDEYFKNIYLDSSSYAISQKQFEWLVQEMQTVKPVLLFIHHPVLKVETEMDNKYPLKEREKLEEVLKRHTKRVYIFCGHYHTCDEKTEENITQFITPAASFQVVKQKGKIEHDTVTFGYRLIDIADSKIDTEVVWLK